jgi:hypothetical protein
VADISNKPHKRERDVFYYRQRLKNRMFAKIVSFFAEEAEKTGITKKDIAAILNRDPAQITRWLSSPSNMTLDSISDLLLAMDAEIDPPPIVRFSERLKPNYAHPLIARVTGQVAKPPVKRFPLVTVDDQEKRKNTFLIEPDQKQKTLNYSI